MVKDKNISYMKPIGGRSRKIKKPIRKGRQIYRMKLKYIFLLLVAIVLVLIGLSLHSEFSIGFDKDCKKGIDYSFKCQDFSVYHRMLFISILCITLGYLLLFISIINIEPEDGIKLIRKRRQIFRK